MRTYIFPIFISLYLFSMIVTDYAFHWAEITPEESLIFVAFLAVPFTMNYAIMLKYELNNIFRDYKCLALLPFAPLDIFLRELLYFIKRPQTLVLLVSVYSSLVYFHWDRTIYTPLSFFVSILFYVAFILFCLIVIRFLFGHNAKGSAAFYTLCIAIGGMALLQILLISKGTTDALSGWFVEKNPLNSLFLLPVIRDHQTALSFLYYLIFMVVALPLVRQITWERILAYTWGSRLPTTQ